MGLSKQEQRRYEAALDLQVRYLDEELIFPKHVEDLIEVHGLFAVVHLLALNATMLRLLSTARNDSRDETFAAVNEEIVRLMAPASFTPRHLQPELKADA